MKKLENIVVFLLTMIMVYAILTMKLYGSVIPPPDLTVTCDGYQNDSHCITGTIVYFVFEPPYGFVPLTMNLPRSVESLQVLEQLEPPVVPPLIEPLIEIPIPAPVPELPMVAATPEPSVKILLLMALVLIIVVRIFKRRP